MLFVLLAILVTAGITYWLIRTYFFASDFDPVELSQEEQVELDTKLRNLGVDPESLLPGANRGPNPLGRIEDEIQRDRDGNLIPEAYSEVGASRVIDLSERELNSMLANNSDLARRFAVDLSDNLASAKLCQTTSPAPNS